MPGIDNPFEGEALSFVHEHGVDEAEARDLVIHRYLMNGDTSALAYWITGDYTPSDPVRFLLSYMLQPDRDNNGDPTKPWSVSPELVPYHLVAKRRGGRRGPKVQPIVAEMNRALDARYQKLKTAIGPGGSDSAILKLEEELAPFISRSAIREAIKSRSPKSRSPKRS